MLSLLLPFPDNAPTEVVGDTACSSEPIATDGAVIYQVVVVREEPQAFDQESQHVQHGSRVRMSDSAMTQQNTAYGGCLH